MADNTEPMDKNKLPTNKRSVTFSDKVVYHIIPGQEEDRMGTWKLDAIRFKMRISKFEEMFSNLVVPEWENRFVLGKSHIT